MFKMKIILYQETRTVQYYNELIKCTVTFYEHATYVVIQTHCLNEGTIF